VVFPKDTPLTDLQYDAGEAGRPRGTFRETNNEIHELSPAHDVSCTYENGHQGGRLCGCAPRWS
jgi:hypothetical protein